MPYFIIVPIWLLVCLAGLIMLAFRPTRLVGALALTTSTAATILSFLLSLAGLLCLGSLAKAVGFPDLAGLAAIAGYIGGMVVGALPARLQPPPRPSSYGIDRG
ncbi:hypothetical protein [Phenylobacterium aquaticum]|uniref:hypothetical protein n=1 Tax=Phenylobacterium aquaticum TaxID=1763816 RepID=UPI001F5CD047|nr:hypothetical protein [Phenylobacterium aquaticum]MCI3132634.1 hypothetical protein [Phenylobacterium aquaticum]